MVACLNEQAEIVKLLLAAKGININVKSDERLIAIDAVNQYLG
jgi:hypothetical protein